MKGIIFIAILAFASIIPLFAQDANVVSHIIESDKVTYGDAEYLCAVESGLAEEDADIADTHEIVQKKYYGKVRRSADANLSYSQAAFLLAKTYKVKKSFMYAIFPTARYAYKMLVADGVIDASQDPHTKITGHQFLYMFSACIDKYGEEQ